MIELCQKMSKLHVMQQILATRHFRRFLRFCLTTNLNKELMPNLCPNRRFYLLFTLRKLSNKRLERILRPLVTCNVIYIHRIYQSTGKLQLKTATQNLPKNTLKIIRIHQNYAKHRNTDTLFAFYECCVSNTIIRDWKQWRQPFRKLFMTVESLCLPQFER